MSIADADVAEQELSWRYATHAMNDAQPRDRAVDREVGMLYATRARAAATEANRTGDFERARTVLERTAKRILGYAHGDAELVLLARELNAEVDKYGQSSMSLRDLKAAVHLNEARARNRDTQGKAQR